MFNAARYTFVVVLVRGAVGGGDKHEKLSLSDEMSEIDNIESRVQQEKHGARTLVWQSYTDAKS